MRLWHWKLIPVLPRQQLLGQWRECCLIAKEIQEKGTPNHILVNPVMNYPPLMFDVYASRVYLNMQARGYSVDWEAFHKYRNSKYALFNPDDLFPGWHTNLYFLQCYYNLQEKHDRGGITDEEWEQIEKIYKEKGASL